MELDFSKNTPMGQVKQACDDRVLDLLEETQELLNSAEVPLEGRIGFDPVQNKAVKLKQQ